ncbi:hypothetical protein HAZT_HAZT006827 [Hyalella azteca]|nr:hypothetical protein HAZT_HAZT006827 [Hyalella azteca]
MESSPLDLSPPHSQPKRARLESEDIDVENDDKSEIYSHNEPYSAPVSNENESESVSVGDCSLKSSQLMNALSLPEDPLKWTVTDVYNFVKSIDICAEYADIFREQRIDGCGLSLLTESHLTTSLHLKLGPALKLRALFDCQMNRNADNTNCAQCPATDADNCFSCDSDVGASEAGAREGSSIHLHHEKEL